MGTTTAPRSRHPQKATIHSGRFSPQNSTASPPPMPAPARRAAKAVAARRTSS